MASFSIGLSLLSSNMLKKTDRREQLSAEGRRILSLLEGRPSVDNDIVREANGRPYFQDRRADFSISHSEAATAVSLVRGEKLRTGCDIQVVKARASTMKIAEVFFSAAERDYIFSRETNKDSEIKFFEIWTLKECFLKLRGLPVFDMSNAPSFVCDAGPDQGHFALGAAVPSPLSFYVYGLPGHSGEQYLLAVAIEGSEQLRPEIRWFSQSFLPARSIAEIKAAASPAETVSPKI